MESCLHIYLYPATVREFRSSQVIHHLHNRGGDNYQEITFFKVEMQFHAAKQCFLGEGGGCRKILDISANYSI